MALSPPKIIRDLDTFLELLCYEDIRTKFEKSLDVDTFFKFKLKTKARIKNWIKCLNEEKIKVPKFVVIIGVAHIYDLFNAKELFKNKVYINLDIFNDTHLETIIRDCAKLYDNFWNSDVKEISVDICEKYNAAKIKTNELINFKYI